MSKDFSVYHPAVQLSSREKMQRANFETVRRWRRKSSKNRQGADLSSSTVSVWLSTCCSEGVLNKTAPNVVRKPPISTVAQRKLEQKMLAEVLPGNDFLQAVFIPAVGPFLDPIALHRSTSAEFSRRSDRLLSVVMWIVKVCKQDWGDRVRRPCGLKRANVMWSQQLLTQMFGEGSLFKINLKGDWLNSLTLTSKADQCDTIPSV